MSFIKNHKFTIIFAVILIVVTLALWWPTKVLPYWWDSAGYIMGAANYYLENNFSSFVIPTDAGVSNFAHPPLFSFILAALWKIFGQSLLVSHVYYLFFVLLASAGTYWLGKEIADFKDDVLNHLVGFGSALLLIFTPLYLAQIGIIYVEIPTAAFAVWAAYFFIKRKVWGYLAAATLMLFMKEVSIVVIGAFGLILLAEFIKKFKNQREERRQLTIKFIKDAAIYAFPALVLAGWFALHKIATGWLFVEPGREFSAGSGEGQLSFVFNYFLTAQSRWMVTVPLFVFLFIIVSRHGFRKFFRKEIYLILLISALVPFLFGTTEFINRYIIFGLPFYFITFSYAWAYILHPSFKEHAAETGKKVVYMGSIALIAFMFSLHWNNGLKLETWHFAPIEENTEYMDVILVGKQTSSYVEQNYPDKTVYTAFPSNYMLSQPFQGYVSKPIEVKDCNKYEEGDEVEVVVFHLLSPPQMQCRNLIQHFGLEPVEEGGFGHNGKWMQVYVAKDILENNSGN